MRALRALALGVVAAAAMTATASAQTKSKVTANELEAVLAGAGLAPTMMADSATGAPVAQGKAGEITFFVRALGCSGAPAACENLVFFANFDLGRTVTQNDFRIVNGFNDKQVFGRAYILEPQSQVGVDYVIELSGGVTMDHLTMNVARWADVIGAFIDSFRAGQGTS
jgi:hypothetical protein